MTLYIHLHLIPYLTVRERNTENVMGNFNMDEFNANIINFLPHRTTHRTSEYLAAENPVQY